MANLISDFVMTLIPLFIVINAFDKVPVIISLSDDMSPQERHKLIHTATITAAVVGVIGSICFAFAARSYPADVEKVRQETILAG